MASLHEIKKWQKSRDTAPLNARVVKRLKSCIVQKFK